MGGFYHGGFHLTDYMRLIIPGREAHWPPGAPVGEAC
jgi:hypothetical protein